ncbi:hypothetical protein [Agaribacterium sp. ZY112]|uniref:hypothetical protein n=1 Tax=Agaribacterium sp. ZY112 TaxID=3233574 RepID=UPI0035240679
MCNQPGPGISVGAMLERAIRRRENDLKRDHSANPWKAYRENSMLTYALDAARNKCYVGYSGIGGGVILGTDRTKPTGVWPKAYWRMNQPHETGDAIDQELIEGTSYLPRGPKKQRALALRQVLQHIDDTTVEIGNAQGIIRPGCNCGEVSAVGLALRCGSNIKDLWVISIKSRKGRHQIEPPCGNCMKWIKATAGYGIDSGWQVCSGV